MCNTRLLEDTKIAIGGATWYYNQKLWRLPRVFTIPKLYFAVALGVRMRGF